MYFSNCRERTVHAESVKRESGSTISQPFHKTFCCLLHHEKEFCRHNLRERVFCCHGDCSPHVRFASPSHDSTMAIKKRKGEREKSLIIFPLGLPPPPHTLKRRKRFDLSMPPSTEKFFFLAASFSPFPSWNGKDERVENILCLHTRKYLLPLSHTLLPLSQMPDGHPPPCF